MSFQFETALAVPLETFSARCLGGIISLDNPTINTWIAIFALSVVLSVGLSWSIVRRRLSGQADVDDIDE